MIRRVIIPEKLICHLLGRKTDKIVYPRIRIDRLIINLLHFGTVVIQRFPHGSHGLAGINLFQCRTFCRCSRLCRLQVRSIHRILAQQTLTVGLHSCRIRCHLISDALLRNQIRQLIALGCCRLSHSHIRIGITASRIHLRCRHICFTGQYQTIQRRKIQ